MQFRASRQRFLKYREAIARRQDDGDAPAPQPSDSPRRAPGKRSRTFFQLFREFLRLLGADRTLVVAALTTLTVSTLLGLIPLYVPKIVIDNVLGGQDLPPQLHALVGDVAPRTLLGVLAAVTITVTCTAIAFSLWSRWQSTRISKHLQIRLRRDVFEHASRLPLHRVYDLKSGGLASILREDAGSVGELLFAMIYNPWRAVTQLTGSLIILAWVDWRLLLGAMALLPVVWYTHQTWISRIRPLFRDIRYSRRHVDAHATEAFGGMRIVRGFGRQQTEATTFTQNNNMMVRQELLAWWWMRGVDTAWAIFIPAATAILLWYGGIRILDDRAAVAAGLMSPEQALTIGDLVMFLSYLAALLGPIEALAVSANGFQNSLAGLDRVLDLLQEEREMPSSPDAIHLDRRKVKGAVRLDDVSFQYPTAPHPALRGVTLDVAPGETIALVGSSGAGKTTLCNLIARFYDPTRGSISLDGADLREIDVESYRRILGIVEQDIFLFDGTVADNVGYGRRGGTHEEIVEAAKAANAHEFIVDLPQGYDTWVGERGVKLSGGQRQRLAIARAILADPRILILDEATSNLDTESERLIQSSLRNLMRDRTSFVIAHRLSTITDADKIVVMEKGRVVEVGKHSDLMRRSGRYQQMVLLQTAKVDDEESRQPREREEARDPWG